MARRANAAMNRGDFQGVGEVFAQDAVLEDLQNAPDQPMKVDGVEAIRTTLSLWAAAFDELHADIEEYIETPNGVVCAAHWRGQGKASGISIDNRQFDLYEFREGKVVRAILGFRSRTEALEAAGLREQRDTAPAMAQENVQIVIDAFTAFNRRDLDAWFEYIADDIDYRAVEGAPDDHGPIHGEAALRVYLQDWLDTFDEFRSEPVELIDAGEGRVIAVTKISGRAKLSGVETGLTYAALYTIRDGKIVRGREYWTKEQALEAAGLRE